MLELVDNRDLKSRAPCGRPGSSPGEATNFQQKINRNDLIFYLVCLKKEIYYCKKGIFIMIKKSILIILVGFSLSFTSCIGSSGSGSISGMHVPSGLK